MEIGSDEELKEKFEYLMRSMERFVPMDTEKESRKRTGVELQTESSKKLKSDTSYAIHCLTLEAAHIYMLTEVKYPLPSRVCQAILEKKLLGDRKDDVCYQLLKLIEKQAQQQ
ncbi:hypothetical protein Tco_0917225 [Tanacetum coccineum]